MSDKKIAIAQFLFDGNITLAKGEYPLWNPPKSNDKKQRNSKNKLNTELIL
jgi:hypothetical protein